MDNEKKTIYEWLRELPEDVQAKIPWDIIKTNVAEYKVSSKSEALEHGFLWKHDPLLTNYWQQLYKTLLEDESNTGDKTGE